MPSIVFGTSQALTTYLMLSATQRITARNKCLSASSFTPKHLGKLSILFPCPDKKHLFSEYGPWTCSVSITWELVRNPESETLIWGPAICVLIIPPGDSDAGSSLKGMFHDFSCQHSISGTILKYPLCMLKKQLRFVSYLLNYGFLMSFSSEKPGSKGT